MADLAGRRALVTGGAGGIGRAAAEALAAAGAEVVVADLSQAACATVAETLRAEGHRASARAFDVTDEAAVRDAFAAEETAGGIDILVTSAAIVAVAPIVEFALDEWDRILRVNLTGTFLCAREAGRRMAARGWGRIVTVSSVNGQTASTGRGAYAVSKGGVDMLTRLLAAELGASGVTANAVAPPPVETDMITRVHGPQDRARWHQRIPAGRYAEPGEVAAAIVFLASDAAAYVNGHVLNVDGGFMSAGILLDRS